MQVPAEFLIKAQELVDPDCGEQERHGQSRRIHRKQKNASGNRLRVRGQDQDSGEDRADARGPAKGESEAEEKTAGYAGKRTGGLGFRLGLAAEIVEAHVAVEPACQRWSSQENQSNREQLHRAEDSARAYRVCSRAPPKN